MVHLCVVACVQCLQHLDVSVLGELVPRLCELLKSGVGLGTKVCTCTYRGATVAQEVGKLSGSIPGLRLATCRGVPEQDT